MATFYIEQFGCRATQADAAAIERQLRERGYSVVRPKRQCCRCRGREHVHRDGRGGLCRRASRFARFTARIPAARIIVTGCYAQRAPEELPRSRRLVGSRKFAQAGNSTPGREIAARVSAAEVQVVPRSERSCRVDHGSENIPHLAAIGQILTGDIFEQQILLVAPVEGGEAGHTRPVLKIQDGCDKRCSYCVIPQVRGRSRSLAPRSRDRGNRANCARAARAKSC